MCRLLSYIYTATIITTTSITVTTITMNIKIIINTATTTCTTNFTIVLLILISVVATWCRVRVWYTVKEYITKKYHDCVAGWPGLAQLSLDTRGISRSKSTFSQESLWFRTPTFPLFGAIFLLVFLL